MLTFVVLFSHMAADLFPSISVVYPYTKFVSQYKDHKVKKVRIEFVLHINYFLKEGETYPITINNFSCQRIRIFTFCVKLSEIVKRPKKRNYYIEILFKTR